MAAFLTQDDMNQIFGVVDGLGISREAIKVPLAPRGDGSVERLPNGHFRIIVPATRPLIEWLPTLREQLQAE